MRRIRRLLLVGLAVWQVIVLLVAVRGVAFPGADTATTMTAEDRESLRSLLQPTEADLERTRQDVERYRPDSLRIPRASWKEALSAALLTGDLHRAEAVWVANRSAVLYGSGAGEVTAALEALQRHPGDLGRALNLAEALTNACNRVDGLDMYLWTLWDGAVASGDRAVAQGNRAVAASDRARVAELLASYADDRAEGAMLRAALQYRIAAGDQTQEQIAEDALDLGIELAEEEQHHLALALFEAVIERTKPGKTWGPAMFNAALMHSRLGQHRAARKTLAQLIDSSVNDQDPGASVMNIIQSYRHRAARLTAVSYRAQGAYPLAYLWTLKAAEDYPYQSWCGTCNAYAKGETERELAADAARMGPLGLVGHMLYRPNLSLLLWIPLGFVSGTVGSLNWWRRRRLRRRIARRDKTVAGSPPEDESE